MASQPSLKITLVKSPIGYSVRQKETVRALGLRKLNQTVIRPDNPQMRGMVFAVQHLVRVEATDAEPALKAKPGRTPKASGNAKPRGTATASERETPEGEKE